MRVARCCATSGPTLGPVEDGVRLAGLLYTAPTMGSTAAERFLASLALNDEATLMVLDRTIGQQMDRVFLDDLRSSEDITLAGFRQRS